MATTLIVTASPQISIPRCILLASNFLSNVPDAQIYVTSASRLKDIGRQRLSPGEKLTASRFALWSDECARVRSSSSPVFVVLDPFETGAGATAPHAQLFASLTSAQSVFLVSSAIELFKKNARGGDGCDWMKQVLEKCLKSRQALPLADLSAAVVKQAPVPTKRPAPDTELAPAPAKNPDFCHVPLPDSLGSLSSHEDDTAAYRLQTLGPERCQMLAKAAPNFICQKGTTRGIAQADQTAAEAGTADDETKRFKDAILNGLDDLIHVYTTCGEEWRMRNYQLARTYMSSMFASLMQRNARFTSCEELQSQIKLYELERACPIGEKTWAKLRDVEEWGSCSEADALMTGQDAVIKREMGAMWGIGPSLLNKFWSRGCRSRADILKQADCPSRCKIADKHFESMQRRMPRCEVDVISKLIFQQILQRYSPKGGEFRYQVVGSYRRGRYDSGDIDCLLSPIDRKLSCSMLPDIIDMLEAQGLACDHLQLPNRNREWVGKNTYMGFTRLPQQATSIKLTAVHGSVAVGDAIVYVSSDRRKLLVSICTKELSSSITGASLFGFDAGGSKVQLFYIASHKFQNGHVSIETYPDASTMELLQPNCCCCLAICTEVHQAGELISDFKTGCSVHAHRRLDMKIYPPEQHATALLYFTGSAHFNRSMRTYADLSGFLLNDYGLFKRLADAARSRSQHHKSPHGDPISCFKEQDIFTHLKLCYVEPERRHDQGDVVAFK